MKTRSSKLSGIQWLILIGVILLLGISYLKYPMLRAWALSLEQKDELSWSGRRVEVYWRDNPPKSTAFEKTGVGSHVEVYVWTSSLTYVSQRHIIELESPVQSIQVVSRGDTEELRIQWCRFDILRDHFIERTLSFNSQGELEWRDSMGE